MWERQRRILTVGLTTATLLAAAISPAPASGWTSLQAESWTAGNIPDVHLRNTYNVFIDVRVVGPSPVHVVRTTARSSADVTDLPPLIGWNCGYRPAFVIPSDDLRSAPGYKTWLASDRPFTVADDRCTYLYARVVPTRKGIVRIDGFDIVYRVGSRTETFRLDYRLTLNVDHEGIDKKTP